MSYNEAGINNVISELGPKALMVFYHIRDHPGCSREDIVKATGIDAGLVERFLITFRSRGFVSYRAIWLYEILEVS